MRSQKRAGEFQSSDSIVKPKKDVTQGAPRNPNQQKKKPYSPPVLECYGKINNFTTGGSGMRSEFAWRRVSSGMGMNMMTTKECVQVHMGMMRNTQRC